MPLEYLLPGTHDNRILQKLIENIANLQNKLIKSSEEFHQVDNQPKLEKNIWNGISLNEIIDIDFEKKVEPLIMNVGTSKLFDNSIEYDFDLLRHQIIFEWIDGRYILKMDKIPQVICYDDLIVKNRIKDLDIKQKKIPENIEKDIIEECKELDEVYSCIKNLETAVGYLRNATVDPKDKIFSTFDYLDLNAQFFPNAARMNCSLEHLQSFWYILLRERSKLVIDNDLYSIDDQCILSKDLEEKVKKHFARRPDLQDFFITYGHDFYCENHEEFKQNYS